MRLIVERLSSLDVNHLHRLGAFKEGRTMWYPAMGIRTSRNLVEYFHARSPADRPPQRIPVQWTRCTFGGARPWLTCLCGRRVGKLYYGNGFLGCRPCGEMHYSSQNAGPRRRLYIKAQRIRRRLGDYDGRPARDAIPSRPYKMQRRTYARLRRQVEMIEHQLRQGRRPYTPRYRKK
jgi:hypothetical protein